MSDERRVIFIVTHTQLQRIRTACPPHPQCILRQTPRVTRSQGFLVSEPRVLPCNSWRISPDCDLSFSHIISISESPISALPPPCDSFTSFTFERADVPSGARAVLRDIISSLPEVPTPHLGKPSDVIVIFVTVRMLSAGFHFVECTPIAPILLCDELTGYRDPSIDGAEHPATFIGPLRGSPVPRLQLP